jgi:signal transduction histidine kinase
MGLGEEHKLGTPLTSPGEGPGEVGGASRPDSVLPPAETAGLRFAAQPAPAPSAAPTSRSSRFRRHGSWVRSGIVAAILLPLLLWAETESYLLFHSLVELFSIVIAASAFVVAWKSRLYRRDGFLFFLGTSLLAVGALDLVHVLVYKGMGVVPGLGSDPATQIWLAARYLMAISLVIAPLFIDRKIRVTLTAAAFGTVLLLVLLAIFTWDVFPTAYVEGQGLTAFKRISEYVICFLLLVAMAGLWRQRQAFTADILGLLLGAMGVTILQELAFTLYQDPYGHWNFVGHALKVVAFFLLYKAIVESGLARPYDLLFHDLQRHQEQLQRLNETLEQRVAMRAAESERRAEQLHSLAVELTGAEERERQRLAQVLHDHLQQLLVAALMRTRMAEGTAHPDRQQQNLQEIIDLLEQSIAASRSLTVELSPPIIRQAGLAAGLDWLQAQVRQTHGLELEVDADARVEPLLQQEVKSFLFRAARELVFNTVKHAGVQRASLRLSREADDQVVLRVEDEGRGCDLAQSLRSRPGGTFGLSSIRERVGLLGGELQVDSAPEAGMHVLLRIPASGQ